MKFVRWFLPLYLIFSLKNIHAQPLRGPVTSSLGGAGVAGMPGAESALLNPALIPLYKESSLEGYFRDGYAANGQFRHAWGVGAIDNGEDVWFPGALHYFRLHDTGRTPQAVDGELWHAALAQQFQRFSVGASVYGLTYDVKNDRRYMQWNYTLGALFMVDETIGVGYVLRSMAGPGSRVPDGLREDLQQTLGVYAGLGEMARIRLDIARQERFNPRHKMAYMFGLESKSAGMMILRLGHRYDDLAGERVWTAGLGFNGPRLKVDYAVEKNQEGTPGALHSVDLRLVF